MTSIGVDSKGIWRLEKAHRDFSAQNTAPSINAAPRYRRFCPPLQEHAIYKLK
jgi:hypothetical protein